MQKSRQFIKKRQQYNFSEKYDSVKLKITTVFHLRIKLSFPNLRFELWPNFFINLNSAKVEFQVCENELKLVFMHSVEITEIYSYKNFVKSTSLLKKLLIS